MRWERGAISPPRNPHEPNLGLVMFYSRLRRLGMGLQASVENRPCGVRVSYYAARRSFPRISTVQRRCAARPCRTRSARLRVALEPPRHRLLRRRRDSSTLPAHGRCRPVTPASLLFPVKRSKTRKARKLEVWTVWTKSRTSSYPIISFMAARFFSVTMMKRQCPPESLAHVSPIRRFSLESSLLTRWLPLYSTTRIRPSTSLQTKSG